MVERFWLVGFAVVSVILLPVAVAGMLLARLRRNRFAVRRKARDV
ncbi:MAG: hypothetical protein R6U89_01775 [Dehalococcoidia bacterium]